MSILASILLLAAGQTAAAEAPPAEVAGPVRMSASQIRAYNAQLTANDPAYIVCVRIEKPGSLVKRTQCRTKGEWDRLAALGQRDATELADYAFTHQFSMGGERSGEMTQTSAQTPY